MKACKDYIKITNKRISFEYALAKDNNDNLEDAKQLVKLLKGMLCHVNLIPINKIENGNYSKSTNENIIKFRDYLNEKGIVATIRRELGSDIDAAFAIGAGGIINLSMPMLILATLVGSILIGIFMVIIGDIGVEHGLSFPVYMRVPFGTIEVHA